MNKRLFKYIAIISLGAGLLFYLASLLCNCTDSSKHLFIGMLGVFIGALAVPEIEEKLIKYKMSYQISIGVLLGALIVFIIGSGSEWYLAGIIGGGIFGASTPIWINGLQLPC